MLSGYGNNVGNLNGGYYNVVIGPSNLFVLLQQNMDMRTRQCVGTSNLNTRGLVSCYPSLYIACSNSVTDCPANSQCVSGLCSCNNNYCPYGGACYAFPVPAYTCPPITGVAHMSNIAATGTAVTVGVPCLSGYIGTPSTITCLNNGVWSVQPSCSLISVQNQGQTTRKPSATPASGNTAVNAGNSSASYLVFHAFVLVTIIFMASLFKH